jgi:hypothetical protein
MEVGMKQSLKMRVAIIVMVGLFAAPVLAADAKKAVSAEATKDIANHRAMAEAHTNAAACFEAGKTEKECHAQLQKDCKGVGIGKFCGMKHMH